MTLHEKLIHALIAYDRKQSTRPGYNPYALPQYFARLQEVEADIANGTSIREAICAGFTGRLANVCLKAVGEPCTNKEEIAHSNRAWAYTPVSGNRADD